MVKNPSRTTAIKLAGVLAALPLAFAACGEMEDTDVQGDEPAASCLLLGNGLIRIGLPLPANRDFDVKVVLNPYASTGANPAQNTVIAPTATPEPSFYRRPLLSGNTRFIAAVMWDGREATV